MSVVLGKEEFSFLGENKKIAIFSSPDGGAFKFEESEVDSIPLLFSNNT